MEDAILTLIRKYINDTDIPLTFTDLEITTIYENMGDNFYLTIAELWLVKAGLLSDSNTTSMSLGNESYSFTDSYKNCMENYNIYKKKGNNNTCNLFEGDASVDSQEETKYNNLMGGKYDSESNEP